MLSLVLKEQEKRLIPDAAVIARMNVEVKQFVKLLSDEVKQRRVDASVFLGGSFAKGTLVRKDKYDIDIFVRFKDNEMLSEKLEKLVARVAKSIGKKYERLHGSRDYFRIDFGDFCFEVVPVLNVRVPKQAQNVTDLSYFHVAYVKRAAKGLEKEIRLAKAFFAAQEAYGAESYIQGFSGYGVECLIIKYRSFARMLQAFVKNAPGSRIIIDSAKHYRNEQELWIELNESKRKGPIVLVDPTFNERNVLAALSWETFDRCKRAAQKFLARPSSSFFVLKEVTQESLKKEAVRKKNELVRLEIETDKPAGDVAGTKLKKFALFVEHSLGKMYVVSKMHFSYAGASDAEVYYIVKPKSKIILRGPPASMPKDVQAFRKAHKQAHLKKDRWYAAGKALPVQSYIEKIATRSALDQMDIIRYRVSIT